MKRTKEELILEVIFEALGEASMCWQPLPSKKQIFDSTKATQIGLNLIDKLKLIDQSTKPIEVSEENGVVDIIYKEFNLDGLDLDEQYTSDYGHLVEHIQLIVRKIFSMKQSDAIELGDEQKEWDKLKAIVNDRSYSVSERMEQVCGWIEYIEDSISKGKSNQLNKREG